MKPETKFRNKILPKLRKIPNSFFESVQQISIRGTPDILGVINARFIALELKVGKNKPSLMQEMKLKQIEEAGGYAKVVYPENFDEVLSELLIISKLTRSN